MKKRILFPSINRIDIIISKIKLSFLISKLFYSYLYLITNESKYADTCLVLYKLFTSSYARCFIIKTLKSKIVFLLPNWIDLFPKIYHIALVNKDFNLSRINKWDTNYSVKNLKPDTIKDIVYLLDDLIEKKKIELSGEEKEYECFCIRIFNVLDTLEEICLNKLLNIFQLNYIFYITLYGYILSLKERIKVHNYD